MRTPKLKNLADDFARKVRDAERRAMARLDLAESQDRRWAIHAEHVQERIAMTLAFLDQLPLDTAEDQIEELRTGRDRHARDFARTGESYNETSAELFTRLVAAAEKRLEERKAEVGTPASA